MTAVDWAKERGGPMLFGGFATAGDEAAVLDDALHAFYSDEWPDLDMPSTEQAILCWQIIERLRREAFPDELMRR